MTFDQCSLIPKDSYEPVLFNELNKYRAYQYSPIPEQMTLLNGFFLVNQKHVSQPVKSESKANNYFGSVLFCELKTKQHDRWCPVPEQITILIPFFLVNRKHGIYSVVRFFLVNPNYGSQPVLSESQANNYFESVQTV